MDIKRRITMLEKRAADGGAVILASVDLDDGRRRVFCDGTSYRLTKEEMAARWPDALVLIGIDPDGDAES